MVVVLIYMYICTSYIGMAQFKMMSCTYIVHVGYRVHTKNAPKTTSKPKRVGVTKSAAKIFFFLPFFISHNS